MIQSSPKTDNSWWYTAAETPMEFEQDGYEAAVWGSDGDMVAEVHSGFDDFDSGREDVEAELRAKRIALLPDLLKELRQEFECPECNEGTTGTMDRCKTCSGTGWNVSDRWGLRDILSEMEILAGYDNGGGD